jgi:hypothetical protein
MRMFLFALVSTLTITANAKPQQTHNFGYSCSYQIETTSDASLKSYYFIEIKNDDVYFWMDISNKHIPNLEEALQSKLQDVGVGQIIGIDKHGTAYVAGDDLVSNYIRNTYKEVLKRGLKLSADLVNGKTDQNAKLHATLYEIDRDSSGNPRKFLKPLKTEMACTRAN